MRSLTFCAICLLAVAAGVGGLRGAQRLGRGESAWAYVGVGKIRSGRRFVEGSDSCGSGSLVVACCGGACGFRPAFNEGAGAVKGTASMRGHRFGARNLALRVLCRGFGLRGHRRCGVHRVSCNAGGFRFRRLRAGLAGCGGLQLYLRSKRQARRAAIDAGLPDAMELLGVAIAAGSPVEQCFRQVAESLSGPLADEFRLVDQEVNLLGHSRAKALSIFCAALRKPGGHRVRRSADSGHRAGRIGGARACQSSCACPCARTSGGARAYQENADEARCGAVRLLFAAYHVAGARSPRWSICWRF